MVITYIATLLILTFTSTNAELEVVASWRLATFAPPPGFPGASPSGSLVHAPNVLFTGIQATVDKFFLSMPRFQPGQPITLGWVPRPPPGYHLPTDTPINAFPDWDWHRAAAKGADSASTNCSAFVCVYHTMLDECGRLWVLDSGVSDTIKSFTVSCPPKLLAFNITTGEVLHRYEFGSDVVKVRSLFTNLALDFRSPPGASCSSPDDLFIYITDTIAPRIVVYDARKCAAWRHDPSQEYPEPDWTTYTTAGESFTLMDGILGITLSNPIVQPIYGSKLFYQERELYFQVFSSDRIYSLPTSALRAQPDNEELPIKLIGRRSSQSVPLVINPIDGSLVFAPLTETAIESSHPAQNTVTVKAYNPDLLQGVEDLYIEPGQIWAVSTRIQKYFHNTVSPTYIEVNKRTAKSLFPLMSQIVPSSVSRHSKILGCT